MAEFKKGDKVLAEGGDYDGPEQAGHMAVGATGPAPTTAPDPESEVES